MTSIVFFDKNHDVVEAYQQVLGNIFTVVQCDVNNLVKGLSDSRKIDAIVSPANSLGWMDGGIDDVYRRIFSEIQSTVRAAIKKRGERDMEDRYYLPVGQVLSVSTGHKYCKKLLVVPTMHVPGPVPAENVYFAALGLFNYLIHEKLGTTGSSTVAIPGLATCTGKVDPMDSAHQILRAWEDSIS